MSHGDLYTVCATIIPVLLLTSSLQVRMYRRYIRDMSEPMTARRHRKKHLWPKLVINLLAALMIISAGIGEWTAIDALAGNRDTAGSRSVVRTSTLTMFGVVAIAVIVEVLEEINRDEQPETTAESQSESR